MKRRRLIYCAIAVVLLLVTIFLRGPFLSNTLKRLILPELELATGKTFTVERIYVNPLPLFIEMRGLKGSDESGTPQISVERVKGYLDLSGLFRKEIVIKKISVHEPVIGGNRGYYEKIVENVRQYLSQQKEPPLKVTVEVLNISNAALSLVDNDPGVLLKGLNAELTLGSTPRCRIMAKQIAVSKKGMPEVSGMLETQFTVKGNEVEVGKLKLVAENSELETSGTVGLGELKAEFNTEVRLLMDSVKRVFNLKKQGEGTVSAKGLIRLRDAPSDIGKVYADMNVEGELYLETLMELLKVEEKLEGYLTVKGAVKGHLNDLTAEARAELKQGNLYSVAVDRLICEVHYREGIMKFSNGLATLYGGSGQADAEISLPVVDHYSLRVRVNEVNSKALFALIDWDPGVPEGKMTGDIVSSGSSFNPQGQFFYRSNPPGKDILDRVREISGKFSMTDNLITFPQIQLSTNRSTIAVTGTVDLKEKALNFSGGGKTDDVGDFATPYFAGLTGPATYTGKISGHFEDPMVDLDISMQSASLATEGLGVSDVLSNGVLALSHLQGSLSYRKNLLTLQSLVTKSPQGEFSAKGTIAFPRARELFQVREPEYNLSLSLKNGDLRGLSGLFHKAPPMRGSVQVALALGGSANNISMKGAFSGKSITLYNTVAADQIEGSVTLDKGELSLDDVRVAKGKSSVAAQGKLLQGQGFSLAVSAQTIRLGDFILPERPATAGTRFPEGITFTNVHLQGEGSLDLPVIEMTGRIEAKTHQGQSLGKGDVKGTLKGQLLKAKATLLDGKVSASGEMDLTGSFPWSARLEMQQGRYDSLITDILVDAPEDLLLNLKGTVTASGDKSHINASAVIERVFITIYGNSFSSSGPISARLNNKKLTIEKMSFRSDEAEFGVSGAITVGESVALNIEGSSSLAPLRALSRQIDLLKGRASYVFTVMGNWSNPQINGGIDISEGSLGLRSVPYRLTSVSAYIYFDGDKVAIQRGSGRLSGGEVNIAGTATLERFRVKRFSLESQMKGISISVSKNFWANFDGNIHYRGNMDSQTVQGGITVNRARYAEKIDLITWLPKARPREKPVGEVTRLSETKLNVRVSATHVVIDNNIARASLRADLLLGGTIGHPVPIGKIETDEGVVYFRGNEFKVTKGRVDFSNPNQIDPYFDVVAETRAENYNVRLSLNGRLEKFNLLLSSNPPLEEPDIFSLLTVGKTADKTEGIKGSIGAGQATSFLAGQLQDEMQERLKTVTGLDRIQVEPSVPTSNKTLAPRVTVSKRLLGDRLYVTYGISTNIGEEQVWKLEYRINNNVSLIGQRDSFGGPGADIKFSFQFK